MHGSGSLYSHLRFQTPCLATPPCFAMSAPGNLQLCGGLPLDSCSTKSPGPLANPEKLFENCGETLRLLAGENIAFTYWQLSWKNVDTHPPKTARENYMKNPGSKRSFACSKAGEGFKISCCLLSQAAHCGNSHGLHLRSERFRPLRKDRSGSNIQT